jgi:putative tRNA adenosine deaminase-associated protein
MSDQSEANAEGIDFAVVAYREEGLWQVEQINEDTIEDLDSLVAELRRWPGDGGAIGMLSIDEDFFLLVRVMGSRVKVLLSDVTAALDWPIARSAVDFLDIPLPEAEDEDDPVPAGDPGIVADLGVGVMDMGVLLDDFELYPDEMLSDIANRLGFGRLFTEVVGVPAP